MTVSTESNKNRYLGNSSTTVFAYAFLVTDQTQLEVIIADSNDVATTLTLSTHYTVSGVGAPGGGNVTTLNLAPITGEAFPELPTGWSITISRQVDFKQLTDLVTQGPYTAETIEDALDYAIFVTQQLQEGLTRAFQVTITSGLSGEDLIAQITAAVAAAAASAAAAAVSAAAALVSETAAAASETAAAASAAAAAIGSFSKDDPGVSVEVLRSTRTSDSPADNDNATFKHFAENDNDLVKELIRLTYTQLDVSDGSEKGRLGIAVADGVDGSIDPVLDIDIAGINLLLGGQKFGGIEVIDASRNAKNLVSTNSVLDSTTAGVTASTTQTQGQQPLTAKVNEVSTVANIGDVVTLPSAVAGLRVTVVNNGANRLQLFPASGDKFSHRPVDISGELGDGDCVSLVAFDSTTWLVEDVFIKRRLDLPTWDMDTTVSIGVSHGLNYQNIRHVEVLIRNDADTVTYDLTGDASVAGIDAYENWDSADINITRVTGGFFDSTNFDSTASGRGFIKIDYLL